MNIDAARGKLEKIRRLSLGALEDLEGDAPTEPPFLDTLEIIGNPARARFPKDTEDHCFNRGTCDMENYGAAIYTSGGGNAQTNPGPIEVWELVPGRATPIVKSYLCREEEVRHFRPGMMSMIVPGPDRRGSRIGAIYELTVGGWQEYRTIPNAGHVTDAALSHGGYWVITDQTKLRWTRTPADSDSWQTLATGDEDTKYRCLLLVRNGLLVIGHDDNEPCMWLYNGYGNTGRTREKLPCFPFPGIEHIFNRPSRAVRYAEGALYLSTLTLYSLSLQTQDYVFYYDGIATAARLVDQGERNIYLRDIVVRGDTSFILAMEENEEPPFTGLVYKSDSLSLDYRLIAEFSAEAMPYSLEELDGELYVALGSGKKETGKPSAALSASGDIGRLVAS